MSGAFVLRGPGPAAVQFLSEVVAALVDGDPDVSERACKAAIMAVAHASGLTPFHREQALNTALDRLTAAGYPPLQTCSNPGVPDADTPLDLHVRDVMLSAIAAIEKRPLAPRRTF